MDLEDFLHDYFELIEKVNDFHFNYLITNKFKFPKQNYLELKRFIDTATNFLSDIDKNILNGVAGKLYGDLNSLYTFYKDFEKKSQYVEVVFYKEYLENLEKYKQLKNEYDELKRDIEEHNHTIAISEEKLKNTPQSSKEYKKLKKIYVDAIYELSKKRDKFKEIKETVEKIEKSESMRFFPEFTKRRDYHLKKLEKIINVKLYYFDKVLWHNASKSPQIIKFFDEAHIDGDFSTKTFIKYFLKNIDVQKSYNSEWVIYLQRILKVLE